jgi:alpha-1,2-mannosyltransferase
MKKKFFIFGFLCLTLITYGGIIRQIIFYHALSDFSLFYHAAHAFFHGQAIYSLTPAEINHTVLLQKKPLLYSANLTPPAFVFLTLPLGLLSASTAFALWSIFSLMLNAVSIYLLYQVFFKVYQRPIIYWALLGIYLAAMPVLANFNLGQLGNIMLFTILWIWILAKKNSDSKAGLLLGLLLSVKYFLGLLAILFLLQKRWRLVACAALSFSIINALALTVFGKESFVQYWQNLHYIVWYANNWNASLLGFFSRFGAREINHVFVLSHSTQMGYYFFSALFFFIQIIICRKPLNTENDFDYAFCYTLIASLLISPLGWLYYLPLMILPILLIVRTLAAQTGPANITAILAFLFMIILLNCPSFMQNIIHVGWRNLSLSIANLFYSLLLLLALLFYAKKKFPSATLLPNQQDLAPWATMAYLASSFSLLFMIYMIAHGSFKDWSMENQSSKSITSQASS